jgi:membrane protease YdiL (CAAX protease family)
MSWRALQWAIPALTVTLLAPVAWRLFARLWRAIDDAALPLQRERVAAGQMDRRPLVAFAWAAAMLTIIEYHGARVYQADVVPWLDRVVLGHAELQTWLGTWRELLGRAFSVAVRVCAYLSPLLFWRRLFPQDRRLDMGLRVDGFFRHAWIYAGCLVLMLPILWLVSQQPAFANYYPKYKEATRSWLDLLAWETMWVAQFFCLEFFFRGFWLYATRSLGAAAVFSMMVPYCMIHFGKPYLEATGAIVTGVVLGTLAMWTRSVWGGFVVHASVAVTMDALALHHTGRVPTLLRPGGDARFEFHGIPWVLGAVWLAALMTFLWQGGRRWRDRSWRQGH